MKTDNLVKCKSFEFALDIIKLYEFLLSKRLYDLSKQILRTGTSIGANIEEALGAQSSKEFLSKPSIAYKEARECHYWLRLLKASNYIDEKRSERLISDCESLVKIIAKIRITTSKRVKSENKF